MVKLNESSLNVQGLSVIINFKYLLWHFRASRDCSQSHVQEAYPIQLIRSITSHAFYFKINTTNLKRGVEDLAVASPIQAVGVRLEAGF